MNSKSIEQFLQRMDQAHQQRKPPEAKPVVWQPSTRLNKPIDDVAADLSEPIDLPLAQDPLYNQQLSFLREQISKIDVSFD